jgi:outer membrane autotransporter protein
VQGVSATSDQDIWFGAAHVRYSRDRDHGDWYLRPSIDAGITHVRAGSFTESGAGGANLEVKSRDHTVLTIEPAVEIGSEIVKDGTLLRPYAKLGLKLFSDTGPDLEATLQGAPAGVVPFTTAGRLDTTVAAVSAGVNILTEQGYSWRIGYKGQFSDRVEDHGAMVKLSIPF